MCHFIPAPGLAAEVSGMVGRIMPPEYADVLVCRTWKGDLLHGKGDISL